MENSQNIPASTESSEEQELSKGWKVTIFSLALISVLIVIYFLTDKESLGELWDMDSVKHYATSVLVTTSIILAFCLYRAIFAKSHSDVSHKTEHALLGGLHGDLISAVMHADERLKELSKDLKKNATEIKKFHRQYLAGLGVISILVMTLIVPVCGLLSVGIDTDPTQFNPLAFFFYCMAYAFRTIVMLYWASALAFGWRWVHEGHKGILLINGVIIGEREFGDGLIFTLPLTGSIKLQQEISEIIIETKLTRELITASRKNAIYEKGVGEAKRLNIDTEDALHDGSLMVKSMTVRTIFNLSNVTVFFKKKISMAEVRECLTGMIESLQVEAVASKTGRQGLTFKTVMEKRISAMLGPKLKQYDNCFNIKDVSIPDFSVMTLVDKKIEVSLLKPVLASKVR